MSQSHPQQQTTSESPDPITKMAVAIELALRWYADERNYKDPTGKYHPPVVYEGGVRARNAIQAMELAREYEKSRGTVLKKYDPKSIAARESEISGG